MQKIFFVDFIIFCLPTGPELITIRLYILIIWIWISTTLVQGFPNNGLFSLWGFKFGLWKPNLGKFSEFEFNKYLIFWTLDFYRIKIGLSLKSLGTPVLYPICEIVERLLQDCCRIIANLLRLSQPNPTLPNPTRPNPSNSSEIYLALRRSGGAGGRAP